MKITPRLTVITLGVRDMKRSIAFYDRLGFERKMKATGDEVAFYSAGAMAIALYQSDKVADEAGVPREAATPGFRGVTLAWNCGSPEEVEASMAHAIAAGGDLIKSVQRTDYGGHAGYFADPDGHVWEIVTAPGIAVQSDGRVKLPD
jgi:predicted lactoylglutathione lyase